MYCEVVVSVGALYAKTFTYEGEGKIGSLVALPFGGREVAGIVLSNVSELSGHKGEIKPISRALYDGHSWLNAELLTLAQNLSKFYLGPLGYALEVMLPVPFSPREVAGWAKGRAHAAKAGELDDLLRAEPECLSSEQTVALARIYEALDTGPATPFLLHGVTGSGKTEVYIKTIAKVLTQNRQAIYLVPEISLTPQVTTNLRARFGQQVGVMHSGLSAGERARTWRAVQRGDISVVVGPRSAVFAPVGNLGVIIMDEEHEASYRHEGGLGFHARTVAQMRAQKHGALLLLGSATPSLEAYHSGERGRTTILSLNSRPAGGQLPQVSIVDMREELRAGSSSLLSRPLHQAMTERLQAGEQALLFFNRRGYAQMSLCTNCGFVAMCPHCDVSLHLHVSSGTLKCHYCGHACPPLTRCPECHSEKVRNRGAGTEKLEEELHKLFPDARISRVDADTTSRKGAHARLLAGFANSPNHILLGTRMITKGLDFPMVTVVGVVDADSGLYFPDFRAVEETFQLIMQVAGRAGRGKLAGNVFVQTFNPGNYAVSLASQQDYMGFYKLEGRLRRRMGYPPFGGLCTIHFRGLNQKRVRESASAVRELFVPHEHTVVLGPAASCPEKVKDAYRWQLTLKARSRRTLQSVVGKLGEEIGAKCATGVHWYVVVD